MTCLPCALEDAATEEVVYRDELWACEVTEGYDVPGWYILRARRHVEGWGGLSVGEAASFGTVAQRVARAMEEATGAPTTYFMSFGENYPHFHFLVIARPPDLPAEEKGAAILARRSNGGDHGAALVTAATVRSALDPD